MEKLILVAYKDGKELDQTEITDTPARTVKILFQLQQMLGNTCKIRRVTYSKPKRSLRNLLQCLAF